MSRLARRLRLLAVSAALLAASAGTAQADWVVSQPAPGDVLNIYNDGTSGWFIIDIEGGTDENGVTGISYPRPDDMPSEYYDDEGDPCKYSSFRDRLSCTVLPSRVVVRGGEIPESVKVNAPVDLDVTLGGDDDVLVIGGSGSRGVIDGGADYNGDELSTARSRTDWRIDLAAGTAIPMGGEESSFHHTGFEHINQAKETSGGGKYVLLGTDGANDIYGGDLGNTIDGRGGRDTLSGGNGNDTITGGPGADYIVCGPGEDTVTDREPEDRIDASCEGRLAVSLTSGDMPGENDLFWVSLEVENSTNAAITDLASKHAFGVGAVPNVFAQADSGQLALYFDSRQPLPTTLESGASFVRTYIFLSTDPGKVLLQAEVTGKNAAGEEVRDAEYAEVGIQPQQGAAANVFEQMAAIEAYATDSYNMLIDASRRWAKKRVKQMHARLPKAVRKRWLGTTKGPPKIRLIDRAMAHMHGMSSEEYVVGVPRNDVVKKGGQRKIDAAERAVREADSGKEKARARRHVKEVRSIQTLDTSELMALKNKYRIETDANELFKIYDDYGEKPAKALYNAGGASYRYLLQFGSYEGRQQIEADMVRYAEANNQSFSNLVKPQAYREAMGQFEKNTEEWEIRRANRRQLHVDLAATDPEKAIFLAAQDESWYGAQGLRGFIEAFAPARGATLAGKPITWGGKVATSKASRASVMVAEATKSGDALVGRKIMHGAEDLGEGVKHADDFTFPSADPDDLLRLDQIGKQGGAGMREQRIAEQINREVTAQLKKEFPHADVEFNMAYKRKKDYDPVGSLAKPQAFAEKILDPRSIQVLGAPEAGLGKQVLFRPDHPSKVAGWKQLPVMQKLADLELYDHHLDQWTNFHKRNPTGKTAEWKKAIGRRHKIDFGGGHTVELDLVKHDLGKNAFEVKAKYMAIDGTVIHKGKPLSIGSDWDPLAAVNVKNGGKKLEGEIERRAFQLWNEKAVKAQKELGFRSGGHLAPMHGLDVTPEQWTKFAKLAAVHLDPAEQLQFEALVVRRAGLPVGTKIFPAGLAANEHLVITTVSDTYVGPLGQIFE